MKKTDIYTSIPKFSKIFHDFLYQKSIFDLLEVCGWLDGGCRSLMKVLQIWLGEENVQTYQIVVDPEEHHSSHVFIKLGNYFIDGDGVSTRKKLHKRWIEEEHLPAVYIRPFNAITEPLNSDGEENFYISNESILHLVSELNIFFDKECVLELFIGKKIINAI
jgi:hypothetical protein